MTQWYQIDWNIFANMYYTFRYRDPSTCSQAQDMRKKGSLSSAVYELTY